MKSYMKAGPLRLSYQRKIRAHCRVDYDGEHIITMVAWRRRKAKWRGAEEAVGLNLWPDWLAVPEFVTLKRGEISDLRRHLDQEREEREYWDAMAEEVAGS